MGATPTPATNIREVIRLPDCKSGVVKRSWKRRAGALPALPTTVECGVRIAEYRMVRCAGLMFLQATLYARHSPFWTLHSALRILHSNAAVVEHLRHPPSKRNNARVNLAGGAMPGGVKVA